MGRRRPRASVPAQRHSSFGAIFERSANPMLLADDLRTIVDANPAAARFLGYSRERLRNLALDDLVAPDAKPAFGEMWIRALKSGGQRATLPFVHASGRRVEAHISTTADIEPGLHLAVFPAGGVSLVDIGDSHLRMALSGGAGKRVGESGKRGDSGTGVLTPRHVEVLTQLAHGASVDEIAESLGIARETVRVHIRNARRRLGARSRTHAVTLAVQRGAITP